MKLNREGLKSKWVAAADQIDGIDPDVFEGIEQGRFTIDIEMNELGLHIRKHIPKITVESEQEGTFAFNVDLNNEILPKNKRKIKIENP
jgi:hypothetical protein